MKAMITKNIITLCLVLLCSLVGYTQPPQGFNYQAVIRDGSGNPLANKNVSLKITLQSATATAYYTESKTLTTTGQGVINYNVGSGTVSFGTFAGVPWNSGDIYLKVEVDPNGGSSYTQMGDPSKLQSVPYALYADGLQGSAGSNGVSIQWLGTLASAPSSPTLNQAYYNSTDKKSYIWNGSAWNVLVQDGAIGPQGPQGAPGTGLTNRGSWSSGASYVNGDYVFDRSLSNPAVNSMWICQVAVGPTSTQPYQDATHWVEFQAPAGPQGDQGAAGTPGSNGANGISIQWQGSLASAPGSPTLNMAYYNTTDKKSYIWNGSAWNTLAVDGANGANGTNGSNGISIQWQGSLASAPGSPTLNMAYYNTTDKKSYIYNGSTWQILTQDGIPISGTIGQTLYYNGTAWTPNSILVNDGTNIGVGSTMFTPTQKLDVNGNLRLRGTLYDYNNSSGSLNQLLTRSASGILWQSLPSIGLPSGTGTSGQLALWSGTNNLQGISNLAWGTTSLQITSPTSAGTDDPILEVKNKDGKVVLGVYQGGVRIYVEDSPIVKGAKGGFAIGGLTNQAKSGPAEYMRITSDSARIYINESTAKGAKGGFAIGGLTNQAKTIVTRDLMFVAPDSARIYIDDSTTPKGAKGGFAIGGLTNQAKGGSANFFNVSTNATNIIYPSEKRVMWYPLKNAFLAGQVIIEKPDSVGLNSFVTGYESKAKGNYSQAFGYQAIARGLYSTAIGYQAIANNNNSFAFGYQAKAGTADSYAFGSGAQALGNKSFAFGSIGIDSLSIVASGSPTGNTKATGDYAFAFGLGSLASGKGSVAMGANNISSGNFSTAIGYSAESSGLWYSTSIGAHTKATNSYAVAIGHYTTASGLYSIAIGRQSVATGISSIANGGYVKAQGNYSVAMGSTTLASGQYSFAMGNTTTASGNASVALGGSTIASGNNSMAFGNGSTAETLSSFAAGYQSKAGNGGVGNYSIALGYQASTTGNYSTAIGRSASATNTDALALGYFTTASGSNSTAFGSQTTASGNYSFVAGYGGTASAYGSTVIGRYNVIEGTTTSWVATDPVFVVGIGTSSSSTSNALTIYKNGNMKIKGVAYPDADNTYDLGSSTLKWRYIYSNNALQTSDIRLKDRIESLNYGLAEILKLKPVSFYWKNNNSGVKNLGFVAQDVKPILSEVVVEGDDPDKTLSMSYTSLIPVIVKGMQEQAQQIENQKKQIEELMTANKMLIERIEKLEKK